MMTTRTSDTQSQTQTGSHTRHTASWLPHTHTASHPRRQDTGYQTEKPARGRRRTVKVAGLDPCTISTENVRKENRYTGGIFFSNVSSLSAKTWLAAPLHEQNNSLWVRLTPAPWRVGGVMPTPQLVVASRCASSVPPWHGRGEPAGASFASLGGGGRSGRGSGDGSYSRLCAAASP